MSTVPCPSCGHGVAVDAKRCPGCGGEISVAKLLVARYPVVGYVAIGLFVALFGYLYYWCKTL